MQKGNVSKIKLIEKSGIDCLISCKKKRKEKKQKRNIWVLINCRETKLKNKGGMKNFLKW